MLQFENPAYLYGLLLLPVLVLLYLYAAFRLGQRKERFGTPALLDRLTPRRSRVRPLVKFALCLLMLALAIVQLARPQQVGQVDGARRKGIEAVIAIDLSQSMLAQDVLPSRLERSKLLLRMLTEKMADDKVGLAIFAGEAYQLLPMTNDKISVQLFLDRLNTDMLSLQGTNLAAAITLADRSFSAAKQVGRAIIVITDGEDHEADAVEAAKTAAAHGHRVYVLGVGTSRGATIPTAEGDLRDNSGQVVVTALNEAASKAVAEAGKGAYIHVDNSDSALEELISQLRELKQADSGVSNTVGTNELFQLLAGLLLGVLCLDFCISEQQQTFWKKWKGA